MRNGTPKQRYEVHLPVAVCGPGRAQAAGVTDYISKRDIRFSVDEPLAVKRGTAIMLFVRLPAQITAGNQVLIRARGLVRRVERISEAGSERQTFTATMDWYDFMTRGLQD